MDYQYTVLALVRRKEKCLLVKHKGPQETSWWLPGGVVEAGEELISALRRELLEETGLHLEGTPRLAFVIQLFREDENSREEAGFAFHFSCDISGQLHPQDPDGIVVSAQWKEIKDVLDLLSVHFWYDCEPLRRYLSGEVGEGIVYTQKIADNQ